MTPKEKANALIDKYKQLSIYPTMSTYGIDVITKHATECAIICVEEIILAIDGSDIPAYNGKGWINAKDYFEEIFIVLKTYRINQK